MFPVRDRNYHRARNTNSALDVHSGPPSTFTASLQRDSQSFLDLLKTVSRKVDQNARNMKRDTGRIREHASRTMHGDRGLQGIGISESRDVGAIHCSSTDHSRTDLHVQEAESRRQSKPLPRTPSDPACQSNTHRGASLQSGREPEQSRSVISQSYRSNRIRKYHHADHTSHSLERCSIPEGASVPVATNESNKRVTESVVRHIQAPITPPADFASPASVLQTKAGSQHDSSHSRAVHPPPLGMRRVVYSKVYGGHSNQSTPAIHKEFKSPLPCSPVQQQLAPHLSAERAASTDDPQNTCIVRVSGNSLPTPDSTPSRLSNPHSSTHFSNVTGQDPYVEDATSLPSDADSSFGNISFDIDDDVLEQALSKYDSMVLK